MKRSPTSRLTSASLTARIKNQHLSSMCFMETQTIAYSNRRWCHSLMIKSIKVNLTKSTAESSKIVDLSTKKRSRKRLNINKIITKISKYLIRNQMRNWLYCCRAKKTNLRSFKKKTIGWSTSYLIATPRCVLERSSCRRDCQDTSRVSSIMRTRRKHSCKASSKKMRTLSSSSQSMRRLTASGTKRMLRSRSLRL